MQKRLGYKTAWLILQLIVIASVAMVAIPVWLIQPFAAQTEKGVWISFLLKNWSPFLTALTTLFAFALVIYIWLKTRRWFSKAILFAPLFVVLICAWFAR